MDIFFRRWPWREQLRREGAELLFVGSQYGSEAKLAKQAGLEFRGLPVRGVLGRGLRSVGALWGLFRAVFMARAIVKDFRPDAVIGFGAYASFPSLVAAKLSGVPIAVHEQNAMPGLTNRMLAKLAKRVFLSLPDVTGAFDAKKSQLTGNPVREAIVESGKNAVGIPVPAVYWSWRQPGGESRQFRDPCPAGTADEGRGSKSGIRPAPSIWSACLPGTGRTVSTLRA